MDPPAAAAVAVGDLPAPPTNRRPLPRQTQRGRTSRRLLGLTLLFTISFAILMLLKLEPLARNSVRDHNNEIDLPLHKTFSGEDPTQKMQAVPTVAEIESTLLKEHMIVHGDFIVEETKNRLNNLAHTYALTYKLIEEFQNQHINVTLTFGSHLGALRHHGVIPFNEKDVDLAVFSTDPVKVKGVIQIALDAQPHLNLTIKEGDYGYQIPPTKKFHTYIDVFMFKNIESKNVTCVGHQLPKLSCKEFYRKVHKRLPGPPVYPYDAWFPFRTELFGTELVPIPATNIPIELGDFETHPDGGKPNFWNTTCGPRSTSMDGRKCSDKYYAYPFVFKMENGIEQLRQGSVVIHEITV